MSFFGSLGTAFGFNSSRDNDQADANLAGLKSSLNGNLQNYGNNVNSLNGMSANIAGQNFYGGADQAYGQQQQAYQNQQNAYNQQVQGNQMLYNQATGQTPSVADLQMLQGLGNANNQIQSAALSQQGGVAPGLSQRNMLNAQAMQNANIVGQGQIARAGEVAQAQQMYNQNLGNISNSAANLGQTAAGMTGAQMALGQNRYNQAANNLNYQTQNLGNYANMANSNAMNLWNSQNTNTQEQAGANAQQAAALGNTIGSVASLALL